MQTIDVIEAARQRILAQRILSGPELMEYFNDMAALHPHLQIVRLQDMAVDTGLYRYLGRRYLLSLTFWVRCAESAVTLALVRSEDELEKFLQSGARSLGRYRRGAKALADLRIEARQAGLYALVGCLALEERKPEPNAVTGTVPYRRACALSSACVLLPLWRAASTTGKRRSSGSPFRRRSTVPADAGSMWAVFARAATRYGVRT